MLRLIHHAFRFEVVRAHEGALRRLKEGHGGITERLLEFHLLVPLLLVIITAFRHHWILLNFLRRHLTLDRLVHEGALRAH